MSAAVKLELPAESGHWYAKDGSPAYEMRGANGRMRPVTLRDARKLKLYPGVSTILGCSHKPALERWKIGKAVESALMLYPLPDETIEAFTRRIIRDAGEQARIAAELGSCIHGQLELAMGHHEFEPKYAQHVVAVLTWLKVQFPDVEFQSERSFACSAGYGGKVDLFARDPPIVLDFKTKDFTSETIEKACGYDEHGMQLAAYAEGLGLRAKFDLAPERWNVFISTSEPGLIAPWYWEPSSYARHLGMFHHLLGYWQADKAYAPESTQ